MIQNWNHCTADPIIPWMESLVRLGPGRGGRWTPGPAAPPGTTAARTPGRTGRGRRGRWRRPSRGPGRWRTGPPPQVSEWMRDCGVNQGYSISKRGSAIRPKSWSPKLANLCDFEMKLTHPNRQKTVLNLPQFKFFSKNQWNWPFSAQSLVFLLHHLLMPMLMRSETLAGGTRCLFAILPVRYDLSGERALRNSAHRARLARLHVVEHIFRGVALWEIALRGKWCGLSWHVLKLCFHKLLVSDGLRSESFRCPFLGTCGHEASGPVAAGSSGVLVG